MSTALALAQPNCLDRIGKYPVVRELGCGPEGSVWLAHDPFAGREVAIKLFDPLTTAQADLDRRFRRALINEAALAGRLSHPHIVSVYDAAADEEICYVVMEYVAGGSLEACCDPARLLAVEQVVEIAFKCALALEHAQHHGVIHRNLKATNILVRHGTDIRVTDFCSGNVERYAASAMRRGNALVGISPERLQGLCLTQQTDIYSLGVVMYRLLTGRGPYPGATDAEIAKEISSGCPLPPSRYRPGLSPALENAVMRALERDTRRRYATWAEFTAALIDAYRGLGRADADESDTERFNVVHGLSFFRDFHDVEIWETLRSASFRRFPCGHTIIREGERGECFYVLASGEVEVTRSGVPLDILTPGDCFGEMLYFSQSSARRTTTIRTLSPVRVLEIDSTALRSASAACQVQFNKAFMRILIDRLTWANAKLAAA